VLIMFGVRASAMVARLRASGASCGIVVLVCSLCCAALGCRRDARHTGRSSPEPAAVLQAEAPRPPLRVVLLTDLEGVLEPCGCTSHPRGGIDRLSAALQALRRDAQATLAIAAGESFTEAAAPAQERAQDTWKADTFAAVLSRFGIAALAPGARDCARAPERIATWARESHAALVSARACGSALEAPAPSALVRVQGIDVGLVAIGSTVAPDVAARRLRALRERGARFTIAVQHDGAAQAVATGESSADFVVHTGAAAETPSAVVGSAGEIVVNAGRRGEDLLALDVWPGRGGGSWRIFSSAPARAGERGVVVQRRAIERDAASDPEVRALLDRLFARINAHNSEAHARTDPTAAAAGASSYAGARTCAACHTPQYLWWQRTPHARAFETLVARGRQLDLDCIGCHVTGYEEPGGSTIGHLDELKGVGCESCHGPGSAHVANPQQPGRAIRRAVPEATCIGCHDPAHSDVFEYAPARARLLAAGHGRAVAAAR
jgi:hypothetical protein